MPNPLMTAGPWRYEANMVVGPNGQLIAFPTLIRSEDQVEANGRALAAAPTLIAALEAIAAMDAGGGMSLGDQVFVVTSARAALRALSEEG